MKKEVPNLSHRRVSNSTRHITNGVIHQHQLEEEFVERFAQILFLNNIGSNGHPGIWAEQLKENLSMIVTECLECIVLTDEVDPPAPPSAFSFSADFNAVRA